MDQSGRCRIFIGESRALLRLALPVWVGQLAFSAAGVVDTLMSGRVGTVDLAGVGMGASTWAPVLFGMTGLLLGVSPMVAQLAGGGKKEVIADVVHHGLLLALMAGLSVALLLQCMGPVLRFMGTPDSVITVTLLYLRGLGLGVPAMAGYLVLKCFSEAMGDTRPQMLISLFGLGCNVCLNFLFIYGGAGIPAMGGAGCGWASGLTFWIMFIGMAVYLMRARAFRSLRWVRRPRFRRAPLEELVRLGGPISLTLFMEASIFGCIILFIGGLGSTVVAGHQVAMNFSGLIYTIPLSIATAITVRVGQATGRMSLHDAMNAAWTGMGLALVVAACTLTVTFLLRHMIVAVYVPDPAVRAMAADLLILGALYQLSDAVMTASLGALRGFRDTAVPMRLTFLAYWGIAMPLGYTLGMTDWLVPRMGAAGFWISLITGLSLAALMLLLRLLRVRKKHIHRFLQ
ncbi:MATE family efflux transporter [Desulfobotulus sp. H1]|uniref:Multidrug-efflux transporter n=1 Tax=Desulfobotulus pelophilus TaxID=2823377 RepID=A0ABT3NAD8_9BACT|nr:MATE family efflux transporter [Desulfobotulus pelophilus]MCW7754438.1 MATE family efflux transporter [Desulfobotulus pelophilus]